MTYARCVSGNVTKVRYPSKARQCREHGSGGYFHAQCGGWHLTSMPQGPRKEGA